MDFLSCAKAFNSHGTHRAHPNAVLSGLSIKRYLVMKQRAML